ncbi:MAG: suppressor of fused domain protein [Thermoanaerobaculia bacterium]
MSPKTHTAIVGIGAGGPVSMIQVEGQQAFVTCELSIYPEQVPSSEGERFELLCRLPLAEDQVQDLLTGLGALSMEAELGDGHTIDVSAFEIRPSRTVVRLSHFSSAVVNGEKFGIYEVMLA